MGSASFSPSVCHPFTFRMVIWPDAINAQNIIAAVSADGSTVWVLMRRLNSFSIPAPPVNGYIAFSMLVQLPCCCSGRSDR